MSKCTVALASALFAASGSAAAEDTSAKMIWGKVSQGMTRAQVEAAYPANGDVTYRDKSIHVDRVAVTPKCKAEADVQFDAAGIVSGVSLEGEGALGGRCADEVLTALSSKYGQPMVSSERNGGILARKGQVYVWNRGDGLTMRYKSYKDGGFGGGKLGQKSWELKYSTAAEAIGL